MPTGHNSFTADITRWVKKTQLRADLVLKKLAFDGFAGVILRSPVDTGRFRASWRIGVDQADKTTEPDRNGVPSPLKGQGGSVPPDGGEAAQAQVKLNTAKFGQTIYITNDLPYGPALENGWSKQAPQGILAITFLELKSNLRQTIAQSQQQVP